MESRLEVNPLDIPRSIHSDFLKSRELRRASEIARRWSTSYEEFQIARRFSRSSTRVALPGRSSAKSILRLSTWTELERINKNSDGGGSAGRDQEFRKEPSRADDFASSNFSERRAMVFLP